MAVSDGDQERVSRLLLHDVHATIGPGHDAVIVSSASSIRQSADDPDYYVYHVVEDVQQYFHDTYVHTTWPTCPRHPNHPMWFKRGWWWCERDGVAVAKLGELAPGRTG